MRDQLSDAIERHHQGNDIKVTRSQLEELLNNSQTQEAVFHGGKSMVVSYLLPNGFTIEGRSAVVNPVFFNEAIGRHCCYEDAIRQLWMLEGYLLQNQIVPGQQRLETEGTSASAIVDF